MERADRLFFVLCTIITVACVVGLVWYAIDFNERQRACEERGGSYEKYNCRTTFVPITTSCGSGCTSTVVVPEEACDYHCVGAAP